MPVFLLPRLSRNIRVFLTPFKVLWPEVLHPMNFFNSQVMFLYIVSSDLIQSHATNPLWMTFLECDGNTSLICMFTRYPGRFSGMLSEGWSSQWQLSPVNPLPCAVYCTIAASIMVHPTYSPGDRSLPQSWPSARHAGEVGEADTEPGHLPAKLFRPPQATGPAVNYSRHRVGGGGDGGWWARPGRYLHFGFSAWQRRRKVH